MPARSRTGVSVWSIVGVLAIVLLIAAILFPVFQKVDGGRRHGHSFCPSNMKQLGLALTQYTQDSDEVLPSGVNAAGNGWAGALYPFIKSTVVYRCPDDPATAPFISYAENQNIVRQELFKFTDPAVTVAFYETTTSNCDPSLPETVSTTGISAPQNSTRHDNSSIPFGLNFATIDGHVKYLSPNKISGGPGAVPAKHIPQGDFVETFAVK